MSSSPQTRPANASTTSRYHLLSIDNIINVLLSRAAAADKYAEGEDQERTGSLESGFSYWMMRTHDNRWVFRVHVNPIPDDQLPIVCERLGLRLDAPEDMVSQ